MQRSDLRLALALSDHLYWGLVCLFPPTFRRAFGPRMRRLFRQCCQEAVQRQGLKGLTRLWLHALADVTVNLMLEWGDTLSQLGRRGWPVLLAPLLGSLAGSLYLHTENWQGLALFLLLCVMGAGLLGSLQQKGAWEWALLIGAGVPFVHLIDLVTGFALPCHMYLSATVLAGTSALVGAFSGVALLTTIRRWFRWSGGERVWLNLGAN